MAVTVAVARTFQPCKSWDPTVGKKAAIRPAQTPKQFGDARPPQSDLKEREDCTASRVAGARRATSSMTGACALRRVATKAASGDCCGCCASQCAACATASPRCGDVHLRAGMRNTISRGQASVVPSLEVLSCTPPAKGRPTRPPRRPPKAQAAARHKTRRGAARGTPPSRGQPRRRPRPPQTAYSSPGPQRMSSRFAVHVRSAARHVVCSVKEMETARCGDWCPAMTCPASSAAASSPFGENNCPCLFLRPAVTTPAVAP